MQLSILTRFLLATNFLLLTAAVYWSIKKWISVNKLHSAPPWLQHRCLIHSSSTTFNNNRWRAEFIVSNFTVPSNLTERAFRYGSPVYNDSRTSALQFIESHSPNTSHPCWLHPDDHTPPRIALSPVNAGPTSSDTDGAIMATLLAVIALFIFLGSVNTAVKPSPAADANTEPLTTQISVPVYSRSSALSPDEIDKLCKRDSKPEIMLEMSPWTEESVCAICLDDEKSMRDAAVLPCGHAFHAGCIRGWLLRGATTCPLCNYSLGEKGGVGQRGTGAIEGEHGWHRASNESGNSTASTLGTVNEGGVGEDGESEAGQTVAQRASSGQVGLELPEGAGVSPNVTTN